MVMIKSDIEQERWTPLERSYRGEWRNLCFTIERFQADGLIAGCHDKYQIAKTYQNYGRDLEQRIADVQQSAQRGNYTFFTDRGIPANVLTPPLVRRMLNDWRGAIASKKTRVAEAFEVRYGEEIGVFLATAQNAPRLENAHTVDEDDAVMQLDRWSRG